MDPDSVRPLRRAAAFEVEAVAGGCSGVEAGVAEVVVGSLE